MKRILRWAPLAVAAALGLGACQGPAGVDGQDGTNGQPGSSCSVVDNGDGTATVTCGTTQVTINDGADGVSCTATDNGDGTSTIDCGAGGSVTVSDGADGLPGDPGASTATLTGLVKNSINGQPVANVTVGITPKATAQTITTDASGVYNVTLPIGSYTLSFTAANHKTLTATVTLVAGVAATVNATIVPTSKVYVTASASVAEATYGDTVSLTAGITAFDGTTATAYEWTQLSGPAASITDGTAETATVVLGNEDAQLDALVEEAMIAHGRLQVIGISPYALEESEVAKFQVEVTTASGTYTGTVSVHMPAPTANGVALHWTNGLRTVPRNVPVLVHAPGDGTWLLEQTVGTTVTDVTSTLAGTGHNRAFVPDVAGKYTLTFTATGATESKSLVVYAGNWAGAIAGINADLTPQMTCGDDCHGSATLDKTQQWAASGHAHIFTNNFNTPGHYGTRCMECHSVGFNEDAANNGIDEATNWNTFLATFTDGAGAIHSEPTNYVELWDTTNTPAMTDVAKYVNIQCENCHGPQSGAGSHRTSAGTTDAFARVDMGSQVCGMCHGEPARHGRFQQWQRSGHGNVELAIEEAAIENRAVSDRSAGPGHCGRCHSAQGFVAWVAQGEATGTMNACVGTPGGKCSGLTADDIAAATATFIALGMNEDNVQPVSCVACHDPHAVGTLSGEPNDATVRMSGSTPKLPSGFYVTGAGKGALCMTCHNTRNGLKNDATWTSDTSKAVSLSAPHHSAQADVLMGENAFFVEVGERSVHANVQNSCVDCHMNKTPPPAQFSYNLAGTNHDFSASAGICANCHTSTSTEVIQDGVRSTLEDVRALAAEGVRRVVKSVVTNSTYGTCSSKYFVTAYVPEDGSAYADWSTAAPLGLTQVPTSVELAGSVHGQPAMTLVFGSPVTVTYNNPDPAGEDYTTTTSTLLVTASSVKKFPDATCTGTLKSIFWGGSGTVDTTNPALDVPSDALAKAIWNMSLIEFDGSFGVHNPPFAHKVLGETYAEMDYWTNTVLGAYE